MLDTLALLAQLVFRVNWEKPRLAPSQRVQFWAPR